MNVNEDAIGEKRERRGCGKGGERRMEDDFKRRGYANKSGQEREDEAKRRALRGQMEWQDGCGERESWRGKRFSGNRRKARGRRVEH